MKLTQDQIKRFTKPCPSCVGGKVRIGIHFERECGACDGTGRVPLGARADGGDPFMKVRAW